VILRPGTGTGHPILAHLCTGVSLARLAVCDTNGYALQQTPQDRPHERILPLLPRQRRPGRPGRHNKFELLLFRLGEAAGTDRRELFGINVFKVREIMVMPALTQMVNAPPHVLGVANIRGQIITVIDLPALTGCTRKSGDGILLVTEFARTTQGFAVEEVTEIVQVDWKHVLSAEGRGGELVTSIARITDCP